MIVICNDGIVITSSRWQVPEKVKEKGIGLINMINIVHSFGGSFSIESKWGEGTIINIVIPNNPLLEKSEVHVL